MPGDSQFERPAREVTPVFSPDEPVAERVLRLVTNLTAELAVVRERLDTLERLLDEKGSVSRADIEAFVPDEATEAERRAWRAEYVERIFAELRAEVDAAMTESGLASAPPLGKPR